MNRLLQGLASVGQGDPLLDRITPLNPIQYANGEIGYRNPAMALGIRQQLIAADAEAALALARRDLGGGADIGPVDRGLAGEEDLERVDLRVGRSLPGFREARIVDDAHARRGFQAASP